MSRFIKRVSNLFAKTPRNDFSSVDQFIATNDEQDILDTVPDDDILSSQHALVSRHLDYLNTAMANDTFDPIIHARLTCSKCNSLLVTLTQGQFETRELPRLFRQRLSLNEVSKNARNRCVTCRLVMAEQILRGRENRRLDYYELHLTCEKWYTELTISRISRSKPQDILTDVLPFVVERCDEGATSDVRCSLRTDSQECLSLAKSWLSGCLASHSKCRMQRDSADWAPTRLIDVRSQGKPRLTITSDLQGLAGMAYVALSHRWSSSRVLQLTTTNINAFERVIPVESLSDSFREAIELVNALDIPYIWIDSLCIVQDSLDDWERESAQMGSVYKNCVLNIAATGDADLGGGLFQTRDPVWVTPAGIRVRHEWHNRNYAIRLSGNIWEEWVTNSPLNKRGWVFQERLLSPRTIHFSTQMFWECREHHACETYPEGLPLQERQSDLLLKDWPQAANQPNYWSKIVKAYGLCSITKQEDRLYAVVGVAKSLQPIFNDVYFAGLWEKDLPYNLAWYYTSFGNRKKPEDYRCPSWSWASLDYPSASISYGYWCDKAIADNLRALVTVQQAHIEPRGCDAFGPLKGGFIRLQGRIRSSIVHMANINLIWDLTGVGWRDEHRREKRIHILPIMTLYSETQSTVWCLLLQKTKVNSHDYVRLGVLSMDESYEDAPNHKWIWDYIRSEPFSIGPDIVTIY